MILIIRENIIFEVYKLDTEYLVIRKDEYYYHYSEIAIVIRKTRAPGFLESD